MDPTQSWRPRTTTVVPANPADASTSLLKLYDLLTDPWEHVNHANVMDFADIRRDLLERLYDWLCDTDDPLLRGAVASTLHRRAIDALEAARAASEQAT